MESYHADQLQTALGTHVSFVQDNVSVSKDVGTLRGLHLQSGPHAQGKFVRCLQGSIVDVAVDVRRGSPTFGHHVKINLSERDGRAFWVPAGFLHGFLTLKPQTIVLYKTTAYYHKDSDISVHWNDKDLGIDWNMTARAPILSDKDANAMSFIDFSKSIHPAAC